MKHLIELFPTIAARIQPPVLVALGSPWPATQFVGALQGAEATCWQLDVFQADRLRGKLVQENLTAEVVVTPDLWDLPARFGTVIYPAAAYADRELKIDVVEQGFHVLREGGTFITLSEYEKDTLFAKLQKKIFGKCGESPKSKSGTAFWSTKTDDHPRRRHEMVFHARIGDGPSMSFISRPGMFGYGRMDMGARAMLEVAQVKPGNHVLDLGCGSGTVGCLAGIRSGPTGKTTFIDSNVRAIALAKINAEENKLPNAEFVLDAKLGGLEPDSYDVILANPPYYADSEVARMFITGARDLLRPKGKFYLVTKMPVQTMPEVVESFGEVEAIENRGYTVLIAQM